MSSNLRELSQCCVYYSAIGMIFMLWVGMMITKQPFYIKGLESEEECRSNAFGAMGFFVFTFVSSLAYLYYDRNRHRYVAIEYFLRRRGTQQPGTTDRDEEHSVNSGEYVSDHQYGFSAHGADAVVIDSTTVDPGFCTFRRRVSQ